MRKRTWRMAPGQTCEMMTIRLWFRNFLLLLALVFLICGCQDDAIFGDNDLVMAKKAYGERNLPLAERLLERYLREEQNSELRWEAWNLLLNAMNANNQEARASLECLEAMLVEYEQDDVKLAEILAKMGKFNEDLHHYDRAANAWSAYAGLGGLDDSERMEGLRRLAAVEFSQRHFDAGEECLQQCLALPLPERDKAWCMLDLADVNMARERWQEVADLCQQILDAQPDRQIAGMAGYLRGDALEQMGQYKQALRQFEEARDYYPNPAVMDNRIANLKKNHSKEAK